MSSVNSALRSVIYGKKDFCCLCLKPDQKETISVDDEITVNINNNELNIDISEVLTSVLGKETFQYITTFNTLCEVCIKSAITWYRFKEATQNNVQYFTRILDTFSSTLRYTNDEVNLSKSLYISVNLNDFTSKHFYDIKRKVLTSRAALRRFEILDKAKNINEDRVSRNDEVEPKEANNYELIMGKRRTFENIPTKEMLFDKNDASLLKCRLCFKEYPRLWALRKHFIRCHAPKVYQCPECPRKYASVSYLNSHKQEKHSCSICSECGKVFSNKSTLKMHEKSHNLRVVCPDCGRVYKNNYTYKQHIDLNVCGRETRAHPSEAKFTCDYCNKKYTQKVSLRVHIQYEHGNYKAHICEWCGKKFWAPSRLKAHIVKHTREKKFSCSLCGGKFVSKESLLYHTRTHTGEKPYKCPHCDSRFLSASRRMVHMKSHHEGGLHECNICHKKFISKICLQKHKRTHTKEDKQAEFKMDRNKRQVNLKPNNNVEVEDIWKINDASLQTILESSVVDMHNFKHEVIQLSEDNVYLEVSDDADEYNV